MPMTGDPKDGNAADFADADASSASILRSRASKVATPGVQPPRERAARNSARRAAASAWDSDNACPKQWQQESDWKHDQHFGNKVALDMPLT